MKKTNLSLNAGRAAILPVLGLVLGLVTPPAAIADSTVYRCGPPGSQRYSQIPCAADSEAVTIKEQHLLGDGVQQSPAAVPDNSSADGEGTATEPANNTEAFIMQLEKQRSEQLAEIDENIAKLQNAAGSPDDGEENAASADETAAVLASLRNTRDSIESEYDAMIRAAQQRIANPE